MANDDPRLIVNLEARIKEFERQMARATKVADREMGGIERRGKQMSASLAGLGKSAFAGFGAGALAALAPISLFNAALDAINDASKIVEVADKVGLTTTALQELSFGFAQAGVDAASFESGMEQFTKRIGVAATSGGKLADILEANGVAIRDSNGQIKSSESLLASYAELVRNAASEQEKLLLVTEAFGRGGGDMVNALNEGAAGINKMKDAAADAGGVIDEALLQAAEKLGDRWDAAWRSFSVSAQSAILTAVVGLDGLRTKFQEFQKAKAAADLGTYAGSLAGTVPAAPTGKDERLAGPDARINDAFNNGIQKADERLVAALKERYGAVATKATIIPGEKEKSGSGGSSRNAAAAAALREAEAVVRVIERLTEERALIGATDVGRQKANALRQAGSAATEEQRAQIEALVEAIYREEQATEAATKASEELRDIGRDVLGGVISDLRDGKDAAEIFAGVVEKLGDKLADLAVDSLFGGASSGGGLAGLFKMFGFAEGGYTGNRGRSQPAGFVHGQEFVVNAKATSRNRNLLEAINSGKRGYAEGGFVAPSPVPSMPSAPRIAAGGNDNRSLHVTVGVSADNNGNLLPFVQSVSDGTVRRAAPGIVGASVKSVRGQLPSMMASAQARNL